MIFPNIKLNDSDIYILKEPTQNIILYIEDLLKKENFTSTDYSNRLFALSLSCFQNLNLTDIFKRKSKIVDQSIYSKYKEEIQSLHKEINSRGMQVVDNVSDSFVSQQIKNIFTDNKPEVQDKFIKNITYSEDKTKDYFYFLYGVFKKLADNNHISSLFQTVYIEYNLHENFNDEQKDFISKNLQKCIDKNFLFAIHYKAILIMEGFYPDKNKDEAISLLIKNGKQGFSASYCVLGELYEPFDIFKSVYYYDLAYKTGDLYAATILGFLHLNQLLNYDTPEKMIPKAIKYLDFAAKKGSIDAKYMLGVLYYEDYLSLGYKTENFEKSISYLKDIYKEKPEACTLLGHIYLKLILDPKYYDHPMNKKFLTMNSKSFEDFLNKNLLLFIKEEDKLRKNISYDNHPGISVHTQYCMYYLSEGVNRDVLQCFYYLGYFFGNGIPNRVEVNKEQSLSLLNKASEMGHLESKKLLKYFEEKFNLNT